MAPAARRLMVAGIAVLVPVAALPAEWSAAPAFSFNADHESNRTLRPGMPGSQSLGASVDLSVARRTESGELAFEPHYYVRRLSPQVQSDVNDLQLPLRLNANFERASLSIGASYADESTLTTELDTTGIIQPGAARIERGADAGWRFTHADAREFNIAVGYSDVDYTGGHEGRLNGYRYASFSTGETLAFSPRLSMTTSGFGSQLRSEERGSDSREAGVSLGFDFAWSEATRLSGSLGISKRDFDGERSTGRSGSFSFSHQGETRVWRLVLDKSLVPYGTGVLTERDTGELSMIQHLDARWLAISRLGVARNQDVLTSSGVDTRTYRYANVELRWRVKEILDASLILGYDDARDPFMTARVDGWTVAIRTRWAPARQVFGH